MFDRELTIVDFEAFFRALWDDKSPFPWQMALARRVLEDTDASWPQAITLPTASGKTACLDIALFSLAAQAGRQARGEMLTAPRRIFFVVDRRVIVDEAFDRARAIAGKLVTASGGILKDVADRLRYLAGGEDEEPLACFQLRGGIYRDDAWARSPIQPTIVCSTVDQIGSRLLFRSYGRSFKSWPLHAGLAGNDSLILLDEAHCAQPFMETLNAVAKYRQWAESPLPSPFRLVIMSATPPESVVDCFPDNETLQANREHPVLGLRIRARKPCRLEVADKAQGKNALPELAKFLVRQAESLAGDTPKAVAILVNRVATAREVHRLLASKGYETALLTGRMRPLDRDDTVSQWLARLSAERSSQRRLERSVFIVATQTLEVGANLDFDAMVSECASLDALRQRFGRLNRMGREIEAKGVIVIRADQAKGNTAPDPVYGTALAATWAWLKAQQDEDGLVDMGIEALTERLPEDLSPYSVQPSHAPVMLPAHVDALVQTSPVPCPSPDVALFLHGPQAGPADVQVCWRADLDVDQKFETDAQREAAWIDAVALCPPAAGELMPVPFATFRRWLAGEEDLADGGDVEGVDTGGEVTEGMQKRLVLRWLGREDAQLVTDPDDIRPGDVVVIPAQLEGWATFGHIPPGAMVDLGDRAHRMARAQAVLRLTPNILNKWPDTPVRERLRALLENVEERLEQDVEAVAAELKDALTALSEDEAAPDWLREIAGHLARERRLEQGLSLHPCGGLVVKGTGRLAGKSYMATGFSGEDDATASGTVRVPLVRHLEGVAEFARRYAKHLPRSIAEDIQLAALCHDLGKADPRFQALLHGGNPWVRSELLAKSGNIPQDRNAYHRALASSGYPRGGRHELLSVRLLESHPDLLARAHDKDLVLHLIASHHGYCRPFVPVVEDPAPQEVRLEFQGATLAASSRSGLERLDSGVAERFWRLVRRYGWWGLAWLEATLMLADHRCSEWEEKAQEGVGRNERKAAIA